MKGRGRPQTRRVRVELEFVVEFDRELDSLPIGSDTLELFQSALCAVLKRQGKRLAREKMAKPVHAGPVLGNFRLDFRKVPE